ncbi:hypothetical protein MML48_4g00002579 [Holotrichia oblita]|uniref:Uncharacterized protein n=1 Tax=Holotrichia oblita TaxID=644536 RepID=A0ACB9T6T4_HOLOL|nr:hypothetical protein MML48_4g00002579 [Holotrichia oblita]
MRNIEIKAKVSDIEELRSKVKILSKSEGTIIKQNDTFYVSSKGRLKLRRFENGDAELIFYDRPDTEGPKLSSYEKSSITSDSVSSLDAVLSQALGVNGIVKKTRHLFLVGQTRVHIDQVENLGDFMELEVVLNEDQSVEEGQEIAMSLMKSLGIEESDLLSGAYKDLM